MLPNGLLHVDTPVWANQEIITSAQCIHVMLSRWPRVTDGEEESKDSVQPVLLYNDDDIDDIYVDIDNIYIY